MTTPRPRYRTPDRDRCSHATLDQQLPADHPARVIWEFTAGLDFSAFDADVKAVEGRPGKPPYPPRLLFSLWLFALIDGVCLARELARRCTRDLPYQWLCGGLAPDYHTLSDFHAGHAGRLRQLFVTHVAALRAQGLVELKRLAVDGTKRPGNAGNATYRREPTLRRHLAEAEEHLRAWEEGRAAAEALTARQRAARRRAARERARRLRRALEQVGRARQQRQQCKRPAARPEEARASEADPDAVRMKQGDGGFRIGYNVQTVTDAAWGLVVTTDVIARGNDQGQLAAQLGRVRQEQGRQPAEVLLDSGYATAADIQQAEDAGVTVIMPPRDEKKDRAAGKDPYARKRDDTAALAGWRARMGTAAARALYRARGGLAEVVHARMVQRRWHRFRLRGLVKVGAEGVWQALAHNVSRLLALGRLLGPAGVRAAGV
jgi:transposase